MAQAGGNAASRWHGAHRCSKQCWARPALAVPPSSASPGPGSAPWPAGQHQAGVSARPHPASPPPASRIPAQRSQQGTSAFLRKTLLSAGDTATEYKKSHRHTHKDKPGPGRAGPPSSCSPRARLRVPADPGPPPAGCPGAAR
ncbi:PREDICTED: translation initiation factor IF-2-like [Ficedula albicollis]|uniref:translation initiation factor IF-2-like n=1 Tax=Ficedula albicollis TaxID=59894 RepID=UPI0003592FA0|nr:PREDICTED: translation initiation factor IF-2-like [Ficedula albicollis]